MKSSVPETIQTCIILFAKAPIPGHVKTRLGKNLGDGLTVSLYRYFVMDMVDKIKAAGHPVKIFYDPPESLLSMQEWLGNQYNYAPQDGGTLGRKMENAFSRVFASGSHRAILVGTDFPDLPSAILTDALACLDTYDAAIGQTHDGGYYLIGFQVKTFLPAVFEGIAWSTPAVFGQTMARFASAGFRVKQLPKWRDIDTYDDLEILIQDLARHPGRAPGTAAFLRKTGLIRNFT